MKFVIFRCTKIHKFNIWWYIKNGLTSSLTLSSSLPTVTVVGSSGLEGGKGRKRMISALVCLGLVLAWTWTRGSLISLQLDFQLSHSCLGLWLRFGMRIIVNVLRDHPFAQVRKPSPEEVTAYQQAIMAKYPSLSEVWGTLDGLNLNIQSTKDDKIQSIFYNGWMHGHYVSSVFIFGMDGVIRICGLNAPGTMHDSTLVDYGNVYEKLEAVFDETGGKVVVDSAFRVVVIVLLSNLDKMSHLAIYRWSSELVTPPLFVSLQNGEWGSFNPHFSEWRMSFA
jgi:hypothetical protein